MLSIAQPSIAPTGGTSRVQGRRLLVVSSGDSAPLVSRVAAYRGRKIEVARVIDVSDERIARLNSELEPEVLKSENIWAILITSDATLRIRAEQLLRCRLGGIRVFSETNFWEEEANWIDIDSRDPGWFLGSRGFQCSWPVRLRVRVFDLFVATLLLAFTFPVMVIVALLIKLDSRGPVFYRQERVGLGGRTFMISKFRSMFCSAEDEGRPRWAQVGDPRITRIGKLIRCARIDELPQLLNVLRGEMSMVGPRPERPYFVQQLTSSIPFYGSRHCVKPGITGWAQVKAPYGASIEDTREKLRYDLYYVKNRSFYLDLRILVRTVRVVVCGEGAR